MTGEANGLGDEVAALLHPWLDGTPHCLWEDGFCPNVHRARRAAESDLLPLFERVQAEAWDRGYEDRERDERREQEHAAAPVQSGCDCMVPTENPYVDPWLALP